MVNSVNIKDIKAHEKEYKIKKASHMAEFTKRLKAAQSPEYSDISTSQQN
jgi:hypothetical protein